MRPMVLILIAAITVAGCMSIRAHPVYRTKRFNRIAEKNPRWADAKKLIEKYNLDNMPADSSSKEVKKENDYALSSEKVMAAELTQA